MTVGLLADLSVPAVRLAQCLSCAAFVEPALARAMRLHLVREATVGDELDVTELGHVEARSSRGFSFGPALLAALRAEISGSPDLEAARGIVARYHERAPELLRIEEEIVWQALRLAAGKLDRNAALGEIERQLERLLEAMEHGDQAQALAMWAARTLARLPAQVVDTSAARILSFVASARIRSARALRASLTPAEAARARRVLPRDRAGAAVYVRLMDQAVELAYEARPAAEGWHQFHVTDTDPALIFVNGVGQLLERGQQQRVPLTGQTPDSQVRLASAEGREWLLLPGDVSQAIASVESAPSTMLAYLVDRDIAITCDQGIGSEIALQFPWGQVIADVIRRLDPAQNAVASPSSPGTTAVLRLRTPAPVAPLTLGGNPESGVEVKVLVRRRDGDDRWMRGSSIGAVGPAALIGIRPSRQLGPDEAASAWGGAVLGSDGLLAGHTMGYDGQTQQLWVSAASSVRAALEAALPAPTSERSELVWPRIAPAAESALPREGSGVAVRVARGLFVSRVDFDHPATRAHLDCALLSLPRPAEPSVDLRYRLWWKAEDPGSKDGDPDFTQGAGTPWLVGDSPPGYLATIWPSSGADPVIASVASAPSGWLVLSLPSRDGGPALAPGAPVAVGERIAGLLFARSEGVSGSRMEWLAPTMPQLLGTTLFALGLADRAGSQGFTASDSRAHVDYLVATHRGRPMSDIWAMVADRLPYRRLAELMSADPSAPSQVSPAAVADQERKLRAMSSADELEREFQSARRRIEATDADEAEYLAYHLARRLRESSARSR